MSYQCKLNKIRGELHPLRKQQGVVIVVALFIVALVATMAYVMMARLERDTRRTQLIVRDTQAEFYAQASVLWAKDLLRSNIEKRKPDALVDVMPVTSPENQENGYRIKSTIYDMQSRFNLNNVSQAEGMAGFERLLKILLPDVKEEQAREIVRAVAEWVSLGQQDGANQYYSELTLPYRAAHRFMQNVSELRLVKGITPSVFQALRPYVTALPVVTPVNVQTAPAPVLASLSTAFTMEAAKALVAVRAQKPFITVEQFKKSDIVKNHSLKDEKGTSLTTVSQFFLVETHVSIENQEAVIYTLLERQGQGNKGTVSILWQSRVE